MNCPPSAGQSQSLRRDEVRQFGSGSFIVNEKGTSFGQVKGWIVFGVCQEKA